MLNYNFLLPGFFYFLGGDAEPVLEVTEVELLPEPEAEPEPEPEPEPQRQARPVKVVQPRKAPRPVAKKLPVMPKPKPKPKPEPRKEKPRVKPPDPMRMKMVEVSNPETETPPENARYLSDKNRRVAKETRARQTNLVRDQPKPRPTTEPNPKQEKEPGAPRKKVAELKRRKAPSKKLTEPRKVSPLLRMRTPKPPPPARQQEALARVAPSGDLAPPRKERRKLKLDLNLDHRAHDRIYGKRAHEARELARLSPSRARGSHQRKWEQVRSALENFVPEVRPGNQTALGTRAHPFALYIARAHRKIHRLWGFGFLVDLDMKSDSHPMNDMSLWTMIEVVLTPDGKVKKTTIVRPSGVLSYDVAALSVVYTAAPYPRAPRAIRSKDGNVYLHWRFHRNQRQCGTFGVDPYILDKPPEGPIDSTMEEVGRGRAEAGGAPRRRLKRLNSHQGHSHAHPAPAPPAAAAAPREAPRASQQPAVTPTRGDDPAAAKLTRRFLARLAARDPAGMAKLCALPFSSGGRDVATNRKELRRMFGDLTRDLGGAAAAGATVKLMTVVQARDILGALPPGAEYGQGMLVVRARVGEAIITLLLKKSEGTLWRVVGLNR